MNKKQNQATFVLVFFIASLFVLPTDVFAARRLRRKPVPPTTQPTVSTTIIPTEPLPTVTLPAPTAVSSVNSATRALWVWGTASKIVSDAQTQNDFFAFIAAPHGDTTIRINRLYFFGDGLNLGTGAASVRAFIKRAHDAGVAVEYLTGDSSWALPGMGSHATSRVDKVIAFNAGGSDRFDGVHFDIEPYLLSGWKTNRSEIASNYMNIMTESRSKILASGQRLTLGVDIPTWFSFDGLEIWTPLTSPGTPIDNATIMNYFDTTTNFLYGYGGGNTAGGIGPNLAASNNLKLTFGAETLATDPNVTFFEEGYSALSSVFAQAAQTFSGHNNFGGLAVHHYDSFRALK